MNNFFIPRKIRPIQEKIEIILIFTFLILILNINSNSLKTFEICGALGDLVPFVQFIKPEKHPWRSINFSKVAG